MGKVFNIVQFQKHPITGETLLTQEQIERLLDHKTIKEWAYICHDKDRFDDDDEEDDFEKCKLEYERLTEVDKSQLTLNEYVDKHHWKFSGKLKPPHYHIVLRTERNMAYETIAGWLGVPDQCIEGARNRRGDKSGDVTFADLIRYLTHEGQEKHRYHDSDVTANFNWRKMLDDIDLKLAKYGNKSVKD